MRRLRRAQVLYRAQLLNREQIPPPGERALCPERNTPVVAQYPVIAPFSSTKASKRSGIERMAFRICSVLFWFSQATALRTRVLKAFCPMGASGDMTGSGAHKKKRGWHQCKKARLVAHNDGRARPLEP